MDIQRNASSITGVVDSTDAAIGNPGTTADTVLTLVGSGTANSAVFIYDNGELLTSASVKIDNTWLFKKTVVLGRHEFTVRDTLSGVDSPAWVVTVGAVAVRPEIASVVDSKGEVPHNGTTSDTTVTLIGTAAANEVVELYLDSVLLGEAPVNPSNIWTRFVSGLTVSRHDFQALGRYGSNPVSDIRSLTVLASAVPTIDSIKDSANVEIPPGGTTVSTSVTLSGTAAASQDVQILDGASVLGTVTTTIGGGWTLTVSSLTVKAYSIKAKGLYGSHPESTVREFSIIQVSSGFENFEQELPRELVRGVPLTLQSGLTIRLLYAGNDPRDKNSIISGNPVVDTPGFGSLGLFLLSHSVTQFKWNGGARQVEFYVAAVDSYSWTAGYYDVDGVFLGELLIPETTSAVGPPFPSRSVVFTRPGVLVGSFEIYNGVDPFDAGIMVDNIRWTN